jgi:hypothetical protein
LKFLASPPVKTTSDFEGHGAQRSPPARDTQRQIAPATHGPSSETVFAVMIDRRLRAKLLAGMTTSMNFLLYPTGPDLC